MSHAYSLEPGVVPGLIHAFRVKADGLAEALSVDRPIELPAADGAWTWLHFNLADKRSSVWITAAQALPARTRAFVLAPAEHQQLYADPSCVYGVFCDLVHEFDGKMDDVGYFAFAITEKLVVTGRRHPLQGVEAVREALTLGLRVASPAALIEILVEQTAIGIDRLLENLAVELDKVEDLVLLGDISDERRRLGRVRRMCVRVHRQLGGLRSTLNRFAPASAPAEALRIATGALVQRLDALDQEVVSVQDRARLLQDEIGSRLSEETARHLNALSILTAVFLPATLVTGVFGMNTSGLPFTAGPAGTLWAIGVAGVAALVAYLALRRSGVIKR